MSAVELKSNAIRMYTKEAHLSMHRCIITPRATGNTHSLPLSLVQEKRALGQNRLTRLMRLSLPFKSALQNQRPLVRGRCAYDIRYLPVLRSQISLERAFPLGGGEGGGEKRQARYLSTSTQIFPGRAWPQKAIKFHGP